ncbi:MAG TPA: hypothetical protein VGE74_27080 [Gemmata sp.]
MPVIVCPKCPTQLKIPDGASGHVKCPKCGTIFLVSAPQPAAALEIVDGRAPGPAAPPPKTAPAAPAGEADFEVVDEEPRKKKKRDYDEDEDERPRSKRGAPARLRR